MLVMIVMMIIVMMIVMMLMMIVMMMLMIQHTDSSMSPSLINSVCLDPLCSMVVRQHDSFRSHLL